MKRQLEATRALDLRAGRARDEVGEAHAVARDEQQLTLPPRNSEIESELQTRRRVCKNRSGKSSRSCNHQRALQQPTSAPKNCCRHFRVASESGTHAYAEHQPMNGGRESESLGKLKRSHIDRQSHDGCANADQSPPELRRVPVR